MSQQTAIQQMIDFINDLNDKDRSEFDYYYESIIEKLNELLKVEKEQTLNTDSVTRFEVIDHTKQKLGRVLVKYDTNVELSFQDDNKTLKVFLTDK